MLPSIVRSIVNVGTIVNMHTNWAVIEINGKRQVVHRRPTPANFVLRWTLLYERLVAL
jgi:hypothetical protein